MEREDGMDIQKRKQTMTREKQLLLPDIGDPGRDVSERWPGSGVGSDYDGAFRDMK
jgi:hypothetical protein